MRLAKIVLVIAIVIGGLISSALYLLSLGVGNGGLGSSYPQLTNLKKSKDQSKIAYKIYSESCGAPVLEEEFVTGLNLDQVAECNGNPKVGGISFVGGNGNEMYLLSHDKWDQRVLLSTYYLLQRGFDGPEKYSLRMDCSAPGFEKRPKMTIGVHYGKKDGGVISYIKSLDSPEPNLDVQYVSGSTNAYSPEGSIANNTSNSISPHAYGQALDVYTYGCTSLYVRLDSEESAAKWACGYTGPANTVYQHSYIYPIKNIANEINFTSSVFDSLSLDPDNGTKPEAYKSYKLNPQPSLASCEGGNITATVPNTCNPAIPPAVTISYKNKGCIAINQPNYEQSYYKSSYFYGGSNGGYWSEGNMSRLQPFQFLQATFLPTTDRCTCQGSSIGSSIAQSEQDAYATKTGPLDFLSPTLSFTVPNERQEGLDNEGLKAYLRTQADAARKIVVESMMLFSLASTNSKYDQANEYFVNLVGQDYLPSSETTVNQILSPSGGSFSFPAGYNLFAKLIYGANTNATDYDPTQNVGRKRGLGYNSTDTDRVHLGF